MSTLSQADWQKVLEVLRSLYEPYSLDKFPARSLAALSKLAGAEIYACHTGSFRDMAAIPRFYTFPMVEIGIAAESFTTQRQHYLDHPVAAHYIRSRDGQAQAISDFLSEPEFHRKASYEAAFQRFGLEDHMVIHFETPVTSDTHSFYKGKDFLGVSLGRDRRNFTERDRLILNLLRPHLQQAHQNAAALTQTQQQLSQLHQATEQIGLIILSVDGKVQWLTPRAEKLLHQYFPPKGQAALPELLQRWVNHQVSTLRQSATIPFPHRPLCLEQNGHRLRMRLYYHSAVGQVHLRLEETQPDCFLLRSLEMLGLTKREAEVLFWVARDESVKAVAKRLGMSDRTLKKHLEHIYQRFGVQTRLAAVMYALERLGIVNP